MTSTLATRLSTYSISLILQRIKIIKRCYSVPVLRDYQQDAIDACVNSIRQGTKRIGVSLATGGGKTVIFSNLINQLRQNYFKERQGSFKSLILVHRRELALQATATLKKIFPDLKVHIEMGKYDCDIEDSDVIVASVQTLIRRLHKYDTNAVNLIIIDEAHHSVANSYRSILDHFKASTAETKIPVIGFSATFERADKRALSMVMDKIVYHRGILEMIDDKWLCEAKFTSVKIEADLSAVKSTADDFQLAPLSSLMNTKGINEVILKTYLHKKQEKTLKSTLLFGVDKAHVQSLHKLFKDNGINTDYVTSDTKQIERDNIIQKFKNGETEVLMNCGIFTEGTDMPNIDCILLCRPTKSRSLLIQMIGRGLRLHHSKDHCHIIDFIGASSVGVVSAPTLLGIRSDDIEFDDATVEDLKAIQGEIIAKQQKIDERLRALFQTDEAAVENVAERNSVADWIHSANSVDLTLCSFDSFRNFTQSNNSYPSGKEFDEASEAVKEMELLMNSQYPWVKFASNAWGLPLKGKNHLRIYKEKSEDKSSIVYHLKMYRQLPCFITKKYADYVPKSIIKDASLWNVMSKVEKIINTLNSDLEGQTMQYQAISSKYSKWRQTVPTSKQRDFVFRKLKKVYGESSKDFIRLSLDDVTTYVNTKMTKGDASNLIFASSLAPVYPLKSLLRILEYQKRRSFIK
ncbi:BAG_1a_G0011670.mRNA.1.CDS.1 [Saccharomyces cerevisiae]|nr:SX2_G0046720.mRNA.1.CDS.1 [Saccharomyces cerevisiae]CAI4360152.1 BAG_1a_G0011670.mRNA.1.CDS.1 [Saccharomyces cerevisiae]CAI7079763.1 BAG_1a_G0011670.mRNA.1.CDS.1 [Saccharomyces cerevisiae]